MSNRFPKLALVTSSDVDDELPIASSTREAATSNFVPKLVPVTAEGDHAHENSVPSLDWYDWAHGVAFGPLDGIEDVIEAARISSTHYLPWQTLPDGTRTHHVDDATEDERREFWRTLSRMISSDGVSRIGDWSDAEHDAANEMAERATRDRLLAAAAEVAHDAGTCAACFLEAALKAFGFTDPAAFEDEDDYDDEDWDEADPDHDH